MSYERQSLSVSIREEEALIFQIIDQDQELMLRLQALDELKRFSSLSWETELQLVNLIMDPEGQNLELKQNACLVLLLAGREEQVSTAMGALALICSDQSGRALLARALGAVLLSKFRMADETGDDHHKLLIIRRFALFSCYYVEDSVQKPFSLLSQEALDFLYQVAIHSELPQVQMVAIKGLLKHFLWIEGGNSASLEAFLNQHIDLTEPAVAGNQKIIEVMKLLQLKLKDSSTLLRRMAMDVCLSLGLSLPLVTLVQMAYACSVPAENKTVVLVVGKTGSGKTSTIRYLRGDPMEKRMNPWIGKEYLIVTQEDLGAYLEVGHSGESHTLFPEIAESYQQEGVVYCDCPGFADNRSENLAICASLGVPLSVGFAARIRGLMVTIERDALDLEYGSGLRGIAEMIGELLQDPGKVLEEIRTSGKHSPIFFVITKAPAGEQPWQLINQVGRVLANSQPVLEGRIRALNEEYSVCLERVERLQVEVATGEIVDEINELKTKIKSLELEMRALSGQLVILQLMMEYRSSVFLLRGDDDRQRQEVQRHIARLISEEVEIPKETMQLDEHHRAFVKLKKLVYDLAHRGSDLFYKQAEAQYHCQQLTLDMGYQGLIQSFKFALQKTDLALALENGQKCIDALQVMLENSGLRQAALQQNHDGVRRELELLSSDQMVRVEYSNINDSRWRWLVGVGYLTKTRHTFEGVCREDSEEIPVQYIEASCVIDKSKQLLWGGCVNREEVFDEQSHRHLVWGDYESKSVFARLLEGQGFHQYAEGSTGMFTEIKCWGSHYRVCYQSQRGEDGIAGIRVYALQGALPLNRRRVLDLQDRVRDIESQLRELRAPEREQEFQRSELNRMMARLKAFEHERELPYAEILTSPLFDEEGQASQSSQLLQLQAIKDDLDREIAKTDPEFRMVSKISEIIRFDDRAVQDFVAQYRRNTAMVDPARPSVLAAATWSTEEAGGSAGPFQALDPPGIG